MADDTGGWVDIPSRESLQEQVNSQAVAHGLDPAFVSRLVHAESKWNPTATSKAGAQGLMQLMPKTAAQYGVTDLLNPEENIKAGIAHLDYLNKKYKGDHTLIAAAYNAGEGAVAAHGNKVPDFKETQDYVRKVAQPDSALTGWEDTPLPKPKEAKGPSEAEQKKADNVAQYAKNNPSLWQQIMQRSGAQGALDVVQGFGQQMLKTGDAVRGAVEKYVPGGAAFNRFVAPLDVALGVGTPEGKAAATTATNAPQKVGQFLGKTAQLAVPAGEVAAGVKAVTAGAGLIPQVLAQGAAGAATAAPIAAAQGDSPVVGAITGGLGAAAAPVVEAALPAVLNSTAVRTMTRAIKPSSSLVRGAPSAWGKTATEKMTNLSKYILENDLTPDKAAAAVKTMNAELESALTSPSGQTVIPDIVKQAEDALAVIQQKFPNAKFSPDVQAIMDKLMKEVPGPQVAGPGTLFNAQGQKIPAMVPGKPILVPRDDVTAEEAVRLARDMRASTAGGYGTAGKSTISADKAAADALREAASKASPEIAGANVGMPQAITASNALSKAAEKVTRNGGKLMTDADWQALAVNIGAAFATHGVTAPALAIPAIKAAVNVNPMMAARLMYSLSTALKSNNLSLARQAITALTQAGVNPVLSGTGSEQ